MSQDSVVAVFSKHKMAVDTLSLLRKRGFRADEASLVEESIENEANRPQSIESGDLGNRNAAIGATIGIFAGGALVIAVFTFGEAEIIPIPETLAGCVTGAIVGAFLGAISGWGLPAHNIQHYAEEISGSKELIVVTSNPMRVAKAHDILTKSDAESVEIYADNSSDDSQIVKNPLQK